MKTKVLAVVLSLVISGGAGLCVNSYAKGVSECDVNPASACTQVKAAVNSGNCTGASTSCKSSACEGSASTKAQLAGTSTENVKNSSKCTTTASYCNNSACVNGTSSAANSNCIKGTSSCNNSSCTKGTSGCTNSTCVNGTSNCESSSCGNSACLQILSNCKNGNCDQNTINSVLQCLKNGSCAKQSSTGTSTSSSKSSATVNSAPSASNTVSASSGSSFSAYENEVISLVNKERTSRGLKALTKNSQLTKTSTLKSEDMAKLNYFSHTSPTYGSPFDMMKQFGISFKTAGENIAMGQKTPAEVMQGWMNSSGHRANILNASYTQIGVGIAKNSSGSLIWTQQFIG